MNSNINYIFAKYNVDCKLKLVVQDGGSSLYINPVSMEDANLFNEIISITKNELREDKLKRILDENK